MEPADHVPVRAGGMRPARPDEAATPVLASSASASNPPPGELVLENGNPAGARRTLCVPATVIGRAAACDIRLKDGGVAPCHCVIVQGRDGFQVRDCRTASGTLVNGQRVSTAPVHDGDTLTIGGYRFRLKLCGPASSGDPIHDALRVQAAAVAAQQSALGEEECRLQQRLDALEQQEQQLSAHLEEERRQLLQLDAQARQERAALAGERAAHEQYVQQIGTDLSAAQRELLEQQQQVQAERSRLRSLRGRLRKHWQRRLVAERRQLAWQAEQLANENCNLAKEAETIAQQREALAREWLAFNTQYELGRRRLQDAWARLRQERQLWRQRRSQEQAALGVRARDLHEQHLALTAAEQHLRHEMESWPTRRDNLQKEVDGLTQRLHHQRDKLLEQQIELNRLEMLLRERRTEVSAAAAVPSPDNPKETAANARQTVRLETAGAEAAAQVLVPPHDAVAKNTRIADLDRLASELTEQRRQLAEQWQRLFQARESWETGRRTAIAEIEALARSIQAEEQTLQERDQACCAAEEELRKKHRELLQMQQHLMGWRARLRACETSWDSERRTLVVEIQQREMKVEQRRQALLASRQRWLERRRQQAHKLKEDRSACDLLRREYTQARQEWQARWAEVEQEKRILAEKVLAVEQLQQEVFARHGDPSAAPRRVERLRRRWLAQNKAVLRGLRKERQALQNELAALEARYAETRRLADEALAAETRLSEQQALWEQQQIENADRLLQVQQDLKIARGQRDCAGQQLEKMKEEIEQIAHTLLEEPAPPCLPAEQAA